MTVVDRAQPSAAGGWADFVRVGTRRAFRVLVWIGLAVLSLTTVFPIAFVVLTTFRTEEDYVNSHIAFPRHVTTSNLRQAWHFANLGRETVNSLIVVSLATCLIVAVTCLAAYALTHLELPLRGPILTVVVGSMFIPPSVLMIPIFRLVLQLGLFNQYFGLVLVYGALNLPFSIFLMASYMRGVPTELLNAAQIDGAGFLRTLTAVVMPLVRPGIMTLIVLNFLVLWNELLFSLLILQDDTHMTVMVGLSQISQGQFQVPVSVASAGLLVSMIPPLLIFTLFQRDLARGMTAGAVK